MHNVSTLFLPQQLLYSTSMAKARQTFGESRIPSSFSTVQRSSVPPQIESRVIWDDSEIEEAQPPRLGLQNGWSRQRKNVEVANSKMVKKHKLWSMLRYAVLRIDVTTLKYGYVMCPMMQRMASCRWLGCQVGTASKCDLHESVNNCLWNLSSQSWAHVVIWADMKG